MLISEMEAILKSLDRRVETLDHRVETLDHRVETLDRRVETLDHRVETLDHRVEKLDHRVGRIEQILPTLATKADLERYATKAELDDRIRGVRVLIEDVRDDVRLVIEHVLTMSNRMTDVVQRLERIEHR